MRRISVAIVLLFAVFSSCGGGGGSAPDAPTGLAVTLTDNGGELIISWTASSGATGYNLYYGASSGVTPSNGNKIENATNPYTHTGLTNGTRLYYIVTATNCSGESSPSAEASNIPQINPIGVLDTDGMPPDGYIRYSTDIPPDNGFNKDVAIDSSGRIVVTGDIYFVGNHSMALWRYNEDGTPDTTFGGDGLVMTTGTAGGTGDYGNGLAIDSSGRIVVAGYGGNVGGNSDMVIWRFDADGNPDMTFNGTGYVLYDRGFGQDDTAEAVKIDSEGRIVVSGSSYNAVPDADMAVWRFEASGSQDNSFGVNGVFFHNNAAGGNGDDVGRSLAVDANNGILVGGDSVQSGILTDIVLWRLTSEGVLDTSFNGDGIVTLNVGDDDLGHSVVFDDDGRILMAAEGGAGGNNELLAIRYTSVGDLDVTFNSDGIFTYSTGDGDSGRGIAVDSRGRILVCGASGVPVLAASNMAIIRLIDDGSLDLNFDGDGVALFHFQADSQDSGNSLAIDSVGRIVVAGGVEVPPVPPDDYYYPIVWRYK